MCSLSQLAFFCVASRLWAFIRNYGRFTRGGGYRVRELYFHRSMDSVTTTFARLTCATTVRGLASAERVFALVDRVPAVALDEGSKPSGEVDGDVEFRDVWFQYQGRDKVRY